MMKMILFIIEYRTILMYTYIAVQRQVFKCSNDSDNLFYFHFENACFLLFQFVLSNF